MSMQARFCSGMYLASNSFAMLWTHPVLLIYLGLAAMIYFFAQIIVCNMGGFSYSEFAFFSGLFDVMLACITFAYIFLITFLNVCIVRHALAIVYDDPERARVFVVLKKTWSVMGRIVTWAFIFTFISTCMRLIAVSTHVNYTAFSLGFLLIILFVVFWFLTTFFVLPIIAVHDVAIWRAIKTSWQRSKLLMIEIIGAECWIGLIAILAFIPLSIILRILGQGTSFGSLIASLIVTLATVLVGYIILSAQAVLKTKLYCHYMQLDEEKSFLSYPHF